MNIVLEIVLRLLAFGVGWWLAYLAVRCALRTFVLPRSAPDPITRIYFRAVRRLFNLRIKQLKTFEEVDGVLAMYAPVTLFFLPVVLSTLMGLGFAFVFYALGVPLEQALIESGSTLLTLGFFVPTQSPLISILAFLEASVGVTLGALLISYLPTMYSAFSNRETLVNLLETRAGSPPSAVYMFELAFPLGRMDHLNELWREWEIWFSQLDETHTSLPVLAFFRSPQPHHSWVTAAGAILDAAALYSSVLNYPSDPQARLCIRAGYLALRHICDFFVIAYHPDPHFPAQPISVTRAEFDEAVERLRVAGLPLKTDLEQAWADFAGWRVNYDATLLALCALVTAPPAPWSSDRAKKWRPAPLLSTQVLDFNDPNGLS
ncbi:MAG: hypothetical protein JNL09_04065 [Anaerolineales bacterium]|nr:hypothetical protein [Anaerolineales bacterium]